MSAESALIGSILEDNHAEVHIARPQPARRGAANNSSGGGGGAGGHSSILLQSESSGELDDDNHHHEEQHDAARGGADANSSASTGSSGLVAPVPLEPRSFAAALIQRSTSAPPQLAMQGLLHDSDPTSGSDLNGDLNEPGHGPSHGGFNTNPSSGGGGGGYADPASASPAAPLTINGEIIRPDDQRLSQDYFNYYYAQKPLDPRLPPPLINWNNWHPRQHHQQIQHSGMGGGGGGGYHQSVFDPRQSAQLLQVADSPQLSSAGSAMLGPTAADLTVLSTLDELQDAEESQDQQQQQQQGEDTPAPLSSSDPSSSVSPGSNGAQANDLENRLSSMSLATTHSDSSSHSSYGMQQHHHQQQQQPFFQPQNMYGQPHQQQHQQQQQPSNGGFYGQPPPPHQGAGGGAGAIDPNALAAFLQQQNFNPNYRGGNPNPNLLAMLSYQLMNQAAAAAAAAASGGNSGANTSALLGRAAAGANGNSSGSHNSPALLGQPPPPSSSQQPQSQQQQQQGQGSQGPIASPAEIQAAMAMFNHLRSQGGSGLAGGQQQQQQQHDYRQQQPPHFGQQHRGGGRQQQHEYNHPNPQQPPQQQHRYGHDGQPLHPVHHHTRGRSRPGQQQQQQHHSHPMHHHPQQHHPHHQLPQAPFNGPIMHIGMDGSVLQTGPGGGPSHLFPAAAHPAHHGAGGIHSIGLHLSSSHPSAHPSREVDDFRHSKTNANLTLHDMVRRGVLVELATDQHGSRFIQQRLEIGNEAERAAGCEAVIPELVRLSHDVFGNYCVQKFLEHGTLEQRRACCHALAGHVFPLSLQMYGCRVVQKCLEVTAETDVASQRLLVSELDGHVLHCVKDQNGNHVIQKAIERVPSQYISFIVDVFQHQVYALSIHPYGCRVIQRLLEHCTSDSQRHYILDEILQNVDELCRNQYGNYVIQHILKFGSPWHKSQIIHAITGGQVGAAAAAVAAPAAVAGTGLDAAGSDVAAASVAPSAAVATTAAAVAASAAAPSSSSSSVDGVATSGVSSPSHSSSSGSSSNHSAAPNATSPRSCKVFQLAKHKFASNVVEKCFTHACAKDRMDLIDQIIGRENERITDSLSSPFLSLVKDQYGNYVIQKMIDEANDEERAIVISRIRRHGNNLRKIPYGKHIVSKLEKITGQPFLPQ